MQSGSPPSEATLILRRFWRSANRVKSVNGRIQLLRQYAEKLVPRDGHRYIDVRRGSRRFQQPAVPCFACRGLATHWHHVIQIQNGGRNKTKNRVPICIVCHRRVHPWMVKRLLNAIGPCDRTARVKGRLLGQWRADVK